MRNKILEMSKKDFIKALTPFEFVYSKKYNCIGLKKIFNEEDNLKKVDIENIVKEYNEFQIDKVILGEFVDATEGIIAKYA